MKTEVEQLEDLLGIEYVECMARGCRHKGEYALIGAGIGDALFCKKHREWLFKASNAVFGKRGKG